MCLLIVYWIRIGTSPSQHILIYYTMCLIDSIGDYYIGEEKNK